jgi:hypothetical protein
MIGAGLGTLSSLFRNVVGGKTLTKRDLEKPMKAMEEHLMKKNVAHEAAVALCEGVEKALIGQTTGSFQSKPKKMILYEKKWGGEVILPFLPASPSPLKNYPFVVSSRSEKFLDFLLKEDVFFFFLLALAVNP